MPNVMDLDAWIDKYKPIPNPRNDTSFSITGDDGKDQCLLYETYGEDHDTVLAMCNENPRRVWTWVETDDDYGVIGDGYSYVNRIGYFITEVPLEDDVPHMIIDLRD